MHLLPAFTARFGADLADFLRLGPNRRYGTELEVASAAMQPLPETEPAGRWSVYATSAGRIGLSIERSLLLRLLQCRYGLSEAGDVEAGALPVTASEERLSQKLGLQLVTTLLHRLDEGLQQAAGTVPGAAGSQPQNAQHSQAAQQPPHRAPAWVAESSMPTGRWSLAIGLAEPDQGSYALLRFSLDDACMRQLLNGLATERAAPRDGGALQQPLAQRLKLTLVAQLLEQRLPLAQILDLRVGDVLPIHLQATEVLVKDARLFTATVAEHKGRLWLTAFEPI